ncbi:hypothetical protein M5K25_000216 [Dendrobium thyrsiflorum]|uniref:Uncharacterized protein n=1 Tax=Dendrobium thyrsiflorum TaxID=117978 RepID=A0ABD0VV19_DENTH
MGNTSIVVKSKNFSKESSCSAPLAVTIDWPEVSYGHSSCPRLFLSLIGCCPELFQVPELHSRILSRANFCCPKIPTVYLTVQKFSAVQIAVQQYLEGSKLLSTSSQAPKMTTGDLVFTDYLGKLSSKSSHLLVTFNCGCLFQWHLSIEGVSPAKPSLHSVAMPISSTSKPREVPCGNCSTQSSAHCSATIVTNQDMIYQRSDASIH